MAEFLVLIAIIIIPLLALAIAAIKWGADSREGVQDTRSFRRPLGIA